MSFEEDLEKMGLVSGGNGIFVSKGMEKHFTASVDGTVQFDLRGAMSEGVDSEGDGDTNTNANSSMDWQVVYDGMNAKRERKYNKAIELFNKAIDENSGEWTHSLVIQISDCYLQKGSTGQALKYAYQACQCSNLDFMALFIKAKCHLKLGDIESAFLSCYCTINSHIGQYQSDNGDERMINVIIPFFQSLNQSLIENLPMGKRELFTMGSVDLIESVSSVPFSLRFNGAQLAVIQENMGSGLHRCQPAQKNSIFPSLVEHTSIAYKSSIVIFGGREDGDKITNATRVLTMDDQHQYSHSIQHCNGDLPTPSQGHAACLVGKHMYVFGGDASLDLTCLDLENWSWQASDSMAQTQPGDRPETDVLFSTLAQFDDTSIVLLGGLFGGAVKNRGDTSTNGMYVGDHDGDRISDNNHIYSTKTRQWKKLPSGSQAPRGYQLQAHNIGDKKVLVLAGHASIQCSKAGVNSLHLLSANTSGALVWEKVEESLNGIPPPLSHFRASTWVPSSRSLMLHGGRYLQTLFDESILETENGQNVKPTLHYDTELYCFQFDLKQWIRLRVGGTTIMRNSHTMTNVDGRLISFGGCKIDSSTRDGRKYVREVTCYDLDLSKVETPKTKPKPKSGKKKGKRGKKKR